MLVKLTIQMSISPMYGIFAQRLSGKFDLLFHQQLHRNLAAEKAKSCSQNAGEIDAMLK